MDSKRRFFIVGDRVRIKCRKDNVTLNVIQNPDRENAPNIYFEGDDELIILDLSPLHLGKSRYGGYGFDSLEMVEPCGEYMGYGARSIATANHDITDVPIKFELESAITETLRDSAEKNFGQPLKLMSWSEMYNSCPAPIRLSTTKWALFGKNNVSYIEVLPFHKWWTVTFSDGTYTDIAPDHARTFLDAIGLPESIEPYIGNQDTWFVNKHQ